MDRLAEQLNGLRLKAEESRNSLSEDPTLTELLESYTKAVFDCTFYHENYLTEKEFKDESSEKDIHSIIELLNAIASLCASADKRQAPSKASNSNSPQCSYPLSGPSRGSRSTSSRGLQSVVNVLGVEFAEIIPWRQGSLLYGFCRTKLTSDPIWLASNQVNFLNYLHEGIRYLQTLLTIRKQEGDEEGEEEEEEEADAMAENEGGLDAEAAAVNVDEDEVEKMRKALLQRQQILGAQGQELEQLQEMLEKQQQMNNEAMLDIHQQILQQPQLEDQLQVVQIQLQANQQETFDQMEDQMEKKQQLQERLLELQHQQQHLNHLQKQLALKKKREKKALKGESDTRSSDEPDTLRLIDIGVYSDTHLLAFMYSGEMCYWYVSHAEEWDLVDPHHGQLLINNLKSSGRSMLKVYIEAVEKQGLFRSGWSSDRAKQLLAYFNSSS